MTMTIAPLVKETSTTTGTGSYTLAGAVSGFRTFATAFTAGASTYLPYVARMGSNWEVGIGLLSAGTTLERTLVLKSSNANAAVSWAAGSKTIYCNDGSLGAIRGRHNFDMTTDPFAMSFPIDNDGYGAGSVIVSNFGHSSGDTGIYMCAVDGAGDIIVIPVHLNGFPARMLDDTGTDTQVGSTCMGASDDRLDESFAYNVTGTGMKGKARWANSRIHGLGVSNGNTYGGHQQAETGMNLETTDATPTVMAMSSGGGSDYLTIEPDSCTVFKAFVVARNNADEVNKAWEVTFAVKRTTTGDPAIFGTPTYTEVGEDAGATTWDIAVGIDTTNDAVKLTATGEAAKTIRWTAYIIATQVAFT